MKILSFGAGAIGTYIGGSLAISGHQVVFVEQPQAAEDLRQSGLKLNLGLDPRRQGQARIRHAGQHGHDRPMPRHQAGGQQQHRRGGIVGRVMQAGERLRRAGGRPTVPEAGRRAPARQ